jgi:nicotinamidase-related amidase
MDALLVIDMQAGMLRGAPKHDLDGVVTRINRAAEQVRSNGGRVVFIQHDGPAGDDFERGTAGWRLLDSLVITEADLIVHKEFNDAFFRTSLDEALTSLGVTRLMIAGWATDFCVDGTVRSAVAHGYRVVVLEDAHTLSDRAHLDAPAVRAHHHFLWANLIGPHPVSFVKSAALSPQHGAS